MSFAIKRVPESIQPEIREPVESMRVILDAITAGTPAFPPLPAIDPASLTSGVADAAAVNAIQALARAYNSLLARLQTMDGQR